LILLARIANQRALNLIHACPSAGGIPTIQYEAFDLEGNMSGRKIDASPFAGRAPRSGPGVDSRDRIVIGNGDIADVARDQDSWETAILPFETGRDGSKGTI
jgi:hypothetical protein